MKNKRIFLNLLIGLIFGWIQIHAQENTNTAGGTASGDGGVIQYSIGQIVYSTSISETGIVSDGVQQPYEIYAITGINLNTIRIDVQVYPNPTTYFLNLFVDNFQYGLMYQLFDNNGKMLKEDLIQSIETQIEMNELIPSTYYIRIRNQNQIIKSFKIIKK